MRLFAFVTALPLMASSFVSALQPLADFDAEPRIVTRDTGAPDLMSPAFAELYDYAVQFVDALQQHDDDGNIQKRAVLENVLTDVLTQVKESQVIEGILYEIAGSKQEIDNLSRGIYSVLAGVMTGDSPLSSLNISMNISTILDVVMGSGIIESVAGDLLLDDQNRENLTSNLGDVLTEHPFIAEILNNIGAGQDLTFDMIFSTARNFESKAPELQSNTTTYSKREDTDYSGTFATFLNNLVNSAFEGDIVESTLAATLKAVQNSGIVTQIVLTATQLPIVNMFGRVLGNLYDYGVFDNIPLNDYFQDAKDSHILAHGLQDLLVSETWSPPLAKVFQQLEDQGTLENVRRSLYG
ncbi:hypothetical protein FT663_04474 [Candidozyma haemuli var. vulneris]|uniref:Opaque-phase-specific protein OP4 n=1 Tax=Candidozyma haemuli TaxID=45357 RepID=A0A2V1AQH5_9ASCO|nr:hypothetical protein CXQ85_001824 [[Candida] haemuloni]KAF3985449.1 hypothetical protein FT662_05145 [[Candida] haemuloni var. vulneris]KAF3987379.1 hypothetical protein FT663_04474 [[Candida] haemuloni var. vulneris]PVH20045.1 hypothetical protein CXQ85_001824 [[Candida] haemuloni]